MTAEIEGTRLNELRAQLRLTVDQLAYEARIDAANLRKYLKPGVHRVRQSTLTRLLDALNCSPERLKPLSLEERFGIELQPVSSNSQIYPGPQNYEDNGSFSFKASFRLTPYADGALSGFECRLFRWKTDWDIPEDWPHEEYRSLKELNAASLTQEQRTRKLQLSEQLRGFPRKRTERQYACNLRPNRRPDEIDEGNVEIDGEYVRLDSDVAHFKKARRFRRNEPLNITYARSCRPGKVDERPIDYLTKNCAHVTCSMVTVMDRDSGFQNLNLDTREWLFWFDYGGGLHQGNAIL